ncbi:MAG: carbonic anhydrase [Pseudonocardiales bacterium]|jgi:carbonic anhydrase|nr:carbonic anhydrase [Pseudonocardiales bacterium]
MDTIDTLSERNAHFAAHQFNSGLAMMPRLKTMIIGCADPRVDPADVLGLNLGDAVVIRNIGGRITPATLQTMAMLRLVAAADPAGPPGAGWNLIVLHHSDCGINRLIDYPDLLAEHFGIDKADLDSKHTTDPWASVATDVAALKANPFLPAELIVSGLVYDVETGLIEQVVGPEPLRNDSQGDAPESMTSSPKVNVIPAPPQVEVSPSG